MAVLSLVSATSDSIATSISRYIFPYPFHTLTTTLYTPVSPPRDPLTTLSPSNSPASSALNADIKDVNRLVISPRRAPGQPGTGVFSLDYGLDVVVRVVRRR